MNAAEKLKILVVDDNEDAATSLSKLLGMMGHHTLVAFDGEEAVDQFSSFRPDVILMDIGLPGMNGYEACSKIRQLPEGRDILMIALTGWGQDEDRRLSDEAGFDKHMVKPPDLDALVRYLGNCRSAKPATLPEP